MFLDAQHQAEAAGVSYDILTEADLTGPNAVANLAQYSALLFPSFQNVQSSQVSAIENTLSQVVYNYHVPIITGGEFMTNDQTGAALPGNVYASMQQLLGVTQSGFGTGTYSVTPDAAALATQQPVMAGYTSGEVLGGASGEFAGQPAGIYTGAGYLTFSGVGGSRRRPWPTSTFKLAPRPPPPIRRRHPRTPTPRPPKRRRRSADEDRRHKHDFRDHGSGRRQQPAAARHPECGVRHDAEPDDGHYPLQGCPEFAHGHGSVQFPDDVGTTGYKPGGTGIYDAMIPILQNLKTTYDFVGSYYINIGDDAKFGQ